MRNQKGFTMIEVFIAIAIMAIMMGIGFPYISGWLPNHRLRNATRDIYSNMQLARMTAIKEHVCYTAVFTESSGDIIGYTIFRDANRNQVQDTDDTELKTVNLTLEPYKNDYKDVYFDKANTAFTNVTFLTNGLIPFGEGGTVRLYNSNGLKKEIEINYPGNIKIIEADKI